MPSKNNASDLASARTDQGEVASRAVYTLTHCYSSKSSTAYFSQGSGQEYWPVYPQQTAVLWKPYPLSLPTHNSALDIDRSIIYRFNHPTWPWVTPDTETLAKDRAEDSTLAGLFEQEKERRFWVFSWTQCCTQTHQRPAGTDVQSNHFSCFQTNASSLAS